MTTSPLQQLLIDKKLEVLSLADKHGVLDIRVFGSVGLNIASLVLPLEVSKLES